MDEINKHSTQISKSISVKIDVKDILELLSKYDEGKSELVAQIEALKSKIAEYETQMSELKQQIAEFNDQKSIEELISELADEPEPNDHKAYNYRGLICYHLDKETRTQAIWDFDKAIELNPNDASYYYNRGLVYKRSWDNNKAIYNFYKAMELDQSFAANAYKKCGDIHLRQGSEYGIQIRYEKAIKEYNKAIEFNPNDDESYYNRGEAYKSLRQYEFAIQDYTKSIELNPDSRYAYKNRGECYKSLGEMEKAQADFEKFNELGYKSWQIRRRHILPALG